MMLILNNAVRDKGLHLGINLGLPQLKINQEFCYRCALTFVTPAWATAQAFLLKLLKGQQHFNTQAS